MRQRILQSLGRIGVGHFDTEEIRLQKTLLLLSTVMIATCGIAWGGIYYYYGELFAAFIPWVYSAVSFVSIGVFGLLRSYKLFRFSQLLLSLLLPFFLMFALGGFVNSSAVVLWSLTSPLGALIFAERREALGWFLAFLGLLACGIFVSDVGHSTSSLPPTVITSFFVMNIGGTSVVAFVLLHRFVSERAKAHKALQEALQRLVETQDRLIQQQKMASLGQLTAGIAHEIKNPLNFVNNFAQLSVELADELREKMEANKDKTFAEVVTDLDDLLNDLKQNAEKICEHGQRADGVVHAMTQHASGGSGQREPTEINQLVSAHIDLAYHGKRAQIQDLNVTIGRDLGDDVSLADVVPQEIGRVLLNLLGNAFDAVYELTQSLDASYVPAVSVSTRQVDGQVEIRVRDNGPGIPAEIQQKIFEPFFTTKPTGSGAGLGLSLSYDIVTQGHGGTLIVESEQGQGATFIVTLPIGEHAVDQT